MPNSASLSFDGSNDLADRASTAGLTIWGDVFIECWIKRSTYNIATKHLFGFTTDVSGNFPYGLSLKPGYLLEFEDILGYSNRLANATLPSGASLDGSWIHVGAKRTGRDVYLYCNGAPFAGPIALGGSTGTGSAGRVGIAFRQYSGYWDAWMDEPRIWSTPPSDADILANYNVQVDPATSGLAALWRANEGSGGTVADLTTNAYDLTISGATWDTSDFPALSDPSGGGGGGVAACVYHYAQLRTG
jgi:hypothetical protein